ncbi:hypothetical protein Tco_0052046 [Tanacetum coccineum]
MDPEETSGIKIIIGLHSSDYDKINVVSSSPRREDKADNGNWIRNGRKIQYNISGKLDSLARKFRSCGQRINKGRSLSPPRKRLGNMLEVDWSHNTEDGNGIISFYASDFATREMGHSTIVSRRYRICSLKNVHPLNPSPIWNNISLSPSSYWIQNWAVMHQHTQTSLLENRIFIQSKFESNVRIQRNPRIDPFEMSRGGELSS